MFVGAVPNSVGHVREADGIVGIGPADAAPEAGVAEHARRRQRAVRVRLRAALPEPECEPRRPGERPVGVGRRLERRRLVDDRLGEDAGPLELAVVGQTGVEPCHIAGCADAAGSGDDRPMVRLLVEQGREFDVVRPEPFTGVPTPVERLEADERRHVVPFVGPETDAGVRHSQRFEHPIGRDLLDRGPRNPPDEFADQPAEGQRVIGRSLAGIEDEVHRFDVLDGGLPVGPRFGPVVDLAVRETGGMGEYLSHRHLGFRRSRVGELGPVVDDPIVVGEVALVDEGV